MSLLKTQLEAVRANAAAIVANCDLVLASLDTKQVETALECQHPKDSRVDTSTMGESSFRCLACGLDVQQGVPT